MSEPQPQFEPVRFDALPSWSDDDHAAALAAFLLSCDKLVAGVQVRAGSGLATPPLDLLATCRAAARAIGSPVSAATARAFFETRFVPYRVVHRADEGFLTGYYEPLVRGSRVRSARYPVPALRRPPELETLISDALRGSSGDALTHARRTETGLVTFATRAEIEAGALSGRGLELVWLEDAVALFFLQVQGSGRVALDDGTTVRITYDGKNGHPYTSIGRHLVESGAMPASAMSLETLAAWLREDAARGSDVMRLNKSYVFFRALPADADAALGVDEIALTPGRSLAVDAAIHTLGLPIYVSAPTLRHAGGNANGGFHRLMIAQDVGSAIRGPERGDIYFGSGDDAGRRAGITKHPGRFFVLLPRQGQP